MSVIIFVASIIVLWLCCLGLVVLWFLAIVSCPITGMLSIIVVIAVGAIVCVVSYKGDQIKYEKNWTGKSHSAFLFSLSYAPSKNTLKR